MGRFMRSCKEQQSPPAKAAAAPYLTLRSGRRVPAAAASCPRQQCRGRRCGKGGSPTRLCHRRQPVVRSFGDRDEEELVPPPPPPSRLENSVGVCSDESCGDSLINREMPSSGEENSISRRPSPPPPEAEIEAFFAAAELAERRRFAETYNYDVALDLPFDGRYEWTPVTTVST